MEQEQGGDDDIDCSQIVTECQTGDQFGQWIPALVVEEEILQKEARPYDREYGSHKRANRDRVGLFLRELLIAKEMVSHSIDPVLPFSVFFLFLPPC